MKKIIVDGNEACARVAYMFSEICGIYPITPASSMASYIDVTSSKGKKNLFNDTVKVVEMQSEAGAIGMMHGSLQAGSLTSTFTASQGLLLMIPNMYKIAGELLPGVIHVASRSLATHALSIMGDHQDIYATRQTGFAIISSSSVEEASDLAGISHLASIKSSVPFLHFFDGFRTSHELNKIEVLEIDDYQKLIDNESVDKFRKRALNIHNPVTRGTNQNDDIYFQATEARNSYYLKVPNIVEDYMKEVNSLKGTEYKPFNYYGSLKADKIIIAMGSVCETIKETIHYLNNNGYNVGLINVHLYRPFSIEHLKKVLPETVKKIAVLDRTKEFGSIGEPLYLDVSAALKDKDIDIVGGRYGLSSKNTNPAHIKAIYDYLNNHNLNTFTIGIKDDITKLSLEVDDDFEIQTENVELKIYGYGSDGMVGMSKDILGLVGEDNEIYIQGYSQYDSKKSRGITRSHLRISKTKIRSSYYVLNPDVVVVSKDSYIYMFDVLEGIKDNGIFILNTDMDEQELKKTIPGHIIKTIKKKNIKMYIINANKISYENGLKNKISIIMEATIFKIIASSNYEYYKEQINNNIQKRFFHKGEGVIKANQKVLDLVDNNITEFKVIENNNEQQINKSDSVYEMMNSLKGDNLPVSAFLNNPDGTFEGGLVRKEKGGNATKVPKWIKENCIQCNKCVAVCPHAVIRSYLVSENEKNDLIKDKGVKAIGKDMKDLEFIIGISHFDCTGCGLCETVCPAKDKAIEMREFDEEAHKQEIFNYLEEKTSKKEIKQTTSKNIQFNKPKFEFSGACAGCGETPYLTMLTRTFGDNMVIANATGCSSIYGGNVPNTTYSVPWINSLFEDNAEFGYGINVSQNNLRDRIKNIMTKTINNVSEHNRSLFNEYLNNYDNYEISKKVYDNLNYDDVNKEIRKLKHYIVKRSTWIIGGDGFAYDIGYGGLDHVLSTNENVNILILNTEVYSNTGGQSSKASRMGSVAEFTVKGKQVHKKDLAMMAMNYPHVYVACVNIMYNQEHYLKVLKEAESHNGPSIIIAYSPCIAHGIDGGMENSLNQGILATKSGYYPIFKYNPVDNKFILSSKDVDFNLYEKFLLSESRYRNLKKLNKEEADKLLELNKEEAIRRYEKYKSLGN